MYNDSRYDYTTPKKKRIKKITKTTTKKHVHGKIIMIFRSGCENIFYEEEISKIWKMNRI